MKYERRAMKVFLAILCGICISCVVHAAAKTCKTAVMPKSEGVGQSGEVTGWRASRTNLFSGAEQASTSAAREAWLANAEKLMLKFLFDHTDTPEMIFAAAEGVEITVPKLAFTNPENNTIPLNYVTDPAKQGFHYEEVPAITVSGLGAEGVLNGTLLLPVSGHTGIANARSWAKTDTYDIYLEGNGNKVMLAQAAKSLDLITLQEVSMVLKAGVEYQLVYNRSGSMGPGGYPDGRIYKITWDGK